MELLLDQGLPRSAIAELARLGIAATHVGDLGMSAAADAEILEHAAENEQVVVSLDSDFHTLLAASGSSGPCVIRVRIEGLKGPDLAEVLSRVLSKASEELSAGAVVSVTANAIRIRRLPIGAKPR